MSAGFLVVGWAADQLAKGTNPEVLRRKLAEVRDYTEWLLDRQ